MIRKLFGRHCLGRDAVGQRETRNGGERGKDQYDGKAQNRSTQQEEHNHEQDVGGNFHHLFGKGGTTFVHGIGGLVLLQAAPWLSKARARYLESPRAMARTLSDWPCFAPPHWSILCAAVGTQRTSNPPCYSTALS